MDWHHACKRRDRASRGGVTVPYTRTKPVILTGGGNIKGGAATGMPPTATSTNTAHPHPLKEKSRSNKQARARRPRSGAGAVLPTTDGSHEAALAQESESPPRLRTRPLENVRHPVLVHLLREPHRLVFAAAQNGAPRRVERRRQGGGGGALLQMYTSK